MSSDPIEALQEELRTKPIEDVAAVLLDSSESIPRRFAALMVVDASSLASDQKASLMLQCLTSSNKQMIVSTIYCLGSNQHPSVSEALRPFLSHPDMDIRREALRALGLLGDVSIISECIRLLREGDESERVAAIITLGAMRTNESLG